MKLKDALPILEKIKYIPFGNLYSSAELSGIKIAKGNAGKLLEKLIGLPPGNTLTDFEDGELKSNKSNEKGEPLETMFISQISSHIDELLDPDLKFCDSWIYEKINRLVYVPVVKVDQNPENWYFLDYKFIEIPLGSGLFQQLEKDFIQIKKKIAEDVLKGDTFIHTSSGTYIQIRTKDSIPYHPIHSRKLKREVSNKNFAFYFKKEFMRAIYSRTDRS